MVHQKKTEKALKEKGEENIPATTPVTEEKPTEEVSEPKEEAKAEAEVKTEGKETETEESSKKGYQQRVRELVKEKNEAKKEAKSLAEKLGELTGSVEPQGEQPYQPQVEPGSEISPDQYKQDVMRTADSLVQLRLKQSEAIARINNEANEALKDYPQLDPKSEDFNEELSESVTEAVEAHVKANPYKASVKTFVSKLMKPYQEGVTKEVGKVTENIAKQASETALRPTNIKAKDKKFEELSESEMEDKLGVVH